MAGDGSRHPACADGETLATTNPGSRLVYICSRNLEREWHYNKRRVRATIIHEALHTLGLGENPPSSDAITGRILAMCGQ